MTFRHGNLLEDTVAVNVVVLRRRHNILITMIKVYHVLIHHMYYIY